MSGRPKALGLHVYSGLWTLGFMDDFDVVGQYEELDAASETAIHNLGNKLEHLIAPSDEWPLEQYIDELDLMFANPPCAPWSAAGGKKGINDPRVAFARNCANAALRVRPSFFIMESVPRAWSEPPRGGRGVYTELAEEFFKEGYGVTILFTNAVLHGAPQFRQRFHFIAHRFELDLRPPEVPTRETVNTVRKSIADLEDTAVERGETPNVPNHVLLPVDERSMNVIQRLRQGEGWEHGQNRAIADGVPYKKNRFIAHRLRYDGPSGVILDFGAVVHPTLDRFLTHREGARLCGYPDDYEFVTSKPSGVPPGSEISQAVLPHIGRYTGREFTRALDYARPVTPGTLDVVDFRPLVKHLWPSKFDIKEPVL